jgi:hypothetical protein
MAALEKRKYYEEFKEWFDDGNRVQLTSACKTNGKVV